RARKEVFDAAAAVAGAERNRAPYVIALYSVVERAMQVVARLERVNAPARRNRSGALNVVEFSKDRVLHRLRPQRRKAGDRNRRKALEALFRRQVDAAVRVPEAELADERRRKDSREHRAARVRAIDDVAAVATEDARDFVVLVPEVVPAHEAGRAAPVEVD